MDRDEAIDRIRRALKARSGKAWSVTGGRGTAYGWLKIDAPPRRCTWHFLTTGQRDESGYDVYDEVSDPEKPFGHMGPAERAELGQLLGLSDVHHQGVSIPAGSDYREEYAARAEGRPVERFGTPYWD